MADRSHAVVSVVIPTYHRPDRLPLAVRSVLQQEPPAGRLVEVVVAVSDASDEADMAAAAALAGDDVVVVVADDVGPARARNAGIRAASGSLIALLDDDCIAQPGWLRAGVAALEGADIVQGSTAPEAEVPLLDHSLWVSPPSWLWESCNLMVRATAIDRGGLFDEDWSPTGRAADHFGEDVEWGWRLVRAGARAAFEPRARVHHAVEPRGLVGFIRYNARSSLFPLLLRSTPEVRRRFYLHYFVNRRHAVLTASAGAVLLALAARSAGARRSATALGVAGLGAYLLPLTGGRTPTLQSLLVRRVAEAVQFGSLVYGSARWRRLLL
jgi:glycosyltransferase involved in cell wall biosynthesis